MLRIEDLDLDTLAISIVICTSWIHERDLVVLEHVGVISPKASQDRAETTLVEILCC